MPIMLMPINNTTAASIARTDLSLCMTMNLLYSIALFRREVCELS